MSVGTLTAKQVEILTKVKNKNPDGTCLSVTQLHKSLSYTCSSQAVGCSVKFLCQRGLIAKTKQTHVVGISRYTLLSITPLGEEILVSYIAPIKSAIVEMHGEEPLEEIL